MKIRRIQITLEPDTRTEKEPFIFTVKVWAEGREFLSQTMMRQSDFSDTFGFVMKDAERRIRDMVAGKRPGEIETT